MRHSMVRFAVAAAVVAATVIASFGGHTGPAWP